MPDHIALLVVLPAALAFACGQRPPSDPADLVVLGAVIHTVDAERPTAEALAVTGGRIVALGTNAEILVRVDDDTEVIDAGGHTVIPGLIDAHAHVMLLGLALRNLDLMGTSSADEIAGLVAEAADGRPAGAWIWGRGWDQNDWNETMFPTRVVLDRVVADHPVFLSRVDGHAAWVNSLALALAGVTSATPDPDGGRIVRDSGGEPTGILIDNAMRLVRGIIPRPDADEREQMLAAAQERMVSLGLTGVHDMGTSDEAIELYRAWAADDRLLPRIAVYLRGSNADQTDAWYARGPVPTDGDGRLTIRSVKFYADGALGSRGAALLAEYSDDVGNVGLLVTSEEVLREGVQAAAAAGFQPAIHAIGDRGNRSALDALVGVDAALRPRIEHAQVVALEDIPRFATQAVVASMQPTHATSDMYWAEERVGPDRIRGAYAWRKMLDAGARLACGSDFPVERVNPFHGLYAAMTRQDQQGWPDGGWYAGEALTRAEALRCFTLDAAWAAFMEDEIGSLAVGKRADLVILDRDILSVAVEDVWQTVVLRTMVDGATVYEEP